MEVRVTGKKAESMTGPRARDALVALVRSLSDDDAVALWQLIASWYPAQLEGSRENERGGSAG